MNKAMKIVATLAVSAFGFGAAAAGAQATPTVGALAGGGAFSGINATGANHTFSVGGAVVTCTNATFTGINGPGAPANTAQFRSAYTGCTINLAGIVCAASVTINGDWRIAATSYVAGTGTGAGTVGAVYRGNVTLLGTNPNAVIRVNDPGCGITTCVINVAPQTVTPGGANPLSAVNTATGIRLYGQATGVATTSSGCPGVPSPATAIYTIPGSAASGGVVVNGIRASGS